jgi:hypothetical protein
LKGKMTYSSLFWAFESVSTARASRFQTSDFKLSSLFAKKK